MVQSSDMNIAANPTGLALRTEINSIFSAIASNHSGASRPSYVTSGMLWLDTSGGATSWVLKLYDGSDDISLGTFNTTSNVFTPANLSGLFGNAVHSKSAASFTATVGEKGSAYSCDATSNNIVANIASGTSQGFVYIFSKVDSSANTVTIDPNGSETINSSSTYVISSQYEGVIVIKGSGSNWLGVPFGNSVKTKISASDTTPAFLESKLIAGDGVALTKQNASGNENIKADVDLDTDSGLEFSSSKLRSKVGTGLLRNSNGLEVDVGTTANKIVQLDGDARLPSVDGRNLTNLSSTSMQVFTSSGTWTKPQGVSTVMVEVIGGGQAAKSVGLSISGGGYVKGIIDVSSLSSVTVTVGEGGDIAGAAGGTSSFGSYLTATGGANFGGEGSFSGSEVVAALLADGGAAASTQTTFDGRDIISGIPGILMGTGLDLSGGTVGPSEGNVGFRGKGFGYGSKQSTVETAGEDGIVIVYW